MSEKGIADAQAMIEAIKRDQDFIVLHLLHQSKAYALALEALRVIAVNTDAVHAPLVAFEALQGCDAIAAQAEAEKKP